MSCEGETQKEEKGKREGAQKGASVPLKMVREDKVMESQRGRQMHRSDNMQSGIYNTAKDRHSASPRRKAGN